METSSSSQNIPSSSSTEASTSSSSSSTMDTCQHHVVDVDEFLNTGRTGRRNALGDILDENSAYLSTSELPDQLSSLSFGSSSNQSFPSSNCQQSTSASSQSSSSSTSQSPSSSSSS